MRIHRYLPRLSLGLLLCFLTSLLFSACGTGRTDNPKEIVFWTGLTGTIEMAAQKKMVAAYEAANPGMKVKIVGLPSGGTADATSLITSVRGGVGPDVYVLDRFTVNQQAAIGLLEDLTPFISKEPNLEQEFQPFAWKETVYQGRSYGLPLDTDARALFYNKKVLRDAGIDPETLDPKNGPITISQLHEMSRKINRQTANGTYDRLGFIPWYDQAFHTTWALNFGAKYFNSDTCEVTTKEPALQKSFQLMNDWAKELNPQKVSTFIATYQPTNALPTQNPFFTNNLAFDVTGDWFLSSLAKYAPDLEYGVTYLPRPDDSDKKPYTWSGGFSLVMPKGAKNQAGGYDFMRFMTGPEGQRIYTKESSHLPTWKALLNEKELFDKGHTFFAELLPYSLSRPALPVGAQISDEFDSVQQKMQYLDGTPAEALEAAYTRIQPQMEQYCPFRLD